MKNISSIKEIFELAIKNHQKSNFDKAEKFYNKILQINPNHFESIFLLGSLSAQTKKLNPAKKLLEKAIQIQPNHANAHNNLGAVLQELKDYEGAINSCQKAIQIQPDHIDAYYNLGNTLKSLGKYEEAKKNYQKVIEIKPDHLDVNNNLGVVFGALGEYEQAFSSYKKAIQIKSNNSYAYYNLGLLFKKFNDLKNSINCYKKAIEIQPNFADAYYVLGNALADIGDFSQAINCYETSIKYDSESLENYFSLSNYKNEVLNLDLKNKVENILKKNISSKKNLAYGNFLLAKYERKNKKYTKELEYLVSGHSLYYESKKGKFNNEINYWLDVLPETEKLFNYEKLSKHMTNNKNKICPIFIIGVPRCGSTLIERVIASGEKYIPIGEETSLIDNIAKEKIYKNETRNFNFNDIKNLIIEKYKKKGLILDQTSHIFTDKSLENFFYISLIKAIFPEAKIINCQRNPLSSIMSILQNNLVKLSWAHNIKNIFNYYDIYLKTVKVFKNKFPNYIYEIQYEKFVQDPETESKKLFKFCNLVWNKKCLEFYKRKDLITQTASNIQVREAIYKHSLDKYLPYKILLNEYGKSYPWFN